jgi:hypothetical protein
MTHSVVSGKSVITVSFTSGASGLSADTGTPGGTRMKMNWSAPIGLEDLAGNAVTSATTATETGSNDKDF